MKTIFILITTCFIGLINPIEKNDMEDLQNCSAELSVEKNRNYKSADEEGASFNLILENTSTRKTTYNISTTNLTTPCGNNNTNIKNSPISNVELNVVLHATDSKGSSLNEVTVNAGQTFKFRVKVNVPEGTPYNNWSCIEVEAKSNDCTSNSVSTILSVYVPNPSEG